MNQWAFVAAAYAVALVGTSCLLLWAWSSMRGAEQAADELKRK